MPKILKKAAVVSQVLCGWVQLSRATRAGEERSRAANKSEAIAYSTAQLLNSSSVVADTAHKLEP